MSVEPYEVKALGAELDSFSDSTVKIFIDIASELLDSNTFGTRYNTAVKLLAAHLLTMSARQGSGGAVESERVGDLSRSYKIPVSDEQYNQTSYGQMFLKVRNVVVFPVRCK